MLSHPNIVTVFDVGEIEGRPYIAMELLDGGALDEEIGRARGLPIRDALSIGIQLANALDFAHAKGIVHRDIKPSNIARIKGADTIKVTDFGIAHIQTSEALQHTRVGTVIGTPHYMSPEQALGHKVDARSDLFCVGVLLYQLLTGQRPFEGDSVVSLSVQIAREEPRPIEQLRREVPARLRRIVDRCLAKQPEQRFQSGRELADALGNVARQLDAEGYRDGRPRGMSLRLKWAFVMAAVVAVTMALTSAFVTNRQYKAMMDQMVEHGVSLAELIATESAVPALSEDWVAVDVFVQDVTRALDLQGLSVIDHTGVVRVSSDGQYIGQPYMRTPGGVPVTHVAGTTVQRTRASSGASVLDFEAPIKFQNKRIGAVRLGLFEEPLAKVARQSWMLMALLLVITVLAVVVATYGIANYYSKPIRLMAESMDEISKGRVGYRIKETRNDEFGVLYQAFDRMAQALERRSKAPSEDMKTPALASEEMKAPVPQSIEASVPTARA